MSKRWSVLVVILVVLLALAPMDALGQKKKKKKKRPPPPPPVQQTVEGNLMFPMAFVDTANPPQTACFAGVHRRLVLAAGDQSRGYFGYHFDVDPATIGGTFVAEVAGGQGSPDLDVLFYSDFGVLAPPANPAETVAYQTRGAGGETGAIPPNMTKVIVCMFSGFDADFKYVGTAAGGVPGGTTGSPTPTPTST